jgi:hypothetical protein
MPPDSVFVSAAVLVVGAYPVTVRDHREALHGSASRRPDASVSASQSCGYPVRKLQLSAL